MSFIRNNKASNYFLSFVLSVVFKPAVKGRSKIIIIGIFILCSLSELKAQDVAPQIWSNAYLGWNINDRFALRSALAYNFLISKEFPWNELTFTTAGVYSFHKYFEASVGLYLAGVKQTVALSSFETRPFLGFRAGTSVQKRYLLSNLSRLELRNIRYSNGKKDVAVRFRNRTYLAYALTQKSMISSKNLFVFGYFEAFYNFDKEVEERFFTQFKYKIGFGYRLSPIWIFDIGVIYQDAANNIVDVEHFPTILTTNYVLDWGVAYIIR